MATEMPNVSFKTTADNITTGHTDTDEFKVALFISQHGLWFLTLVAVTCNTLSFITISSIKPFAPSSFYVALLAVLDTMTLTTRLIYQKLTAFDVPMGDAGCKIIMFLMAFFLYLSVWTLVIMTIERFVAVCFPLRVTELFTMRRAKLSVLITAGICILINITLLRVMEEWVTPNKETKRSCDFGPDYKHATITWYWVNSCIYAFVPCAVVIILNALIIYRLNQSFRIQRQMRNGDVSTSSTSAQQKQITVMLVAVSVGFVIMLTPICIFYLAPPKKKELQILYAEIAYFIAELNHALNFFFYFFSSRKFRSMLIRLVTCKHGVRRRSTVQSQQGVSSATQSISMSNEL